MPNTKAPDSIVRRRSNRRVSRTGKTWMSSTRLWFWWLLAAVLAQRPDLKTPAWIDRKLPSYALRHVRHADLVNFRVGRRRCKKMNIARWKLTDVLSRRRSKVEKVSMGRWDLRKFTFAWTLLILIKSTVSAYNSVTWMILSLSVFLIVSCWKKYLLINLKISERRMHFVNN